MNIEQLFSVRNQSALVTGGASGLGLGIARALAANGAKVTIVDVNAEAITAALPELGANAAGEVADIADRAAIEATIDRTAERQGGLDILVANAGIGGGPGFGVPGGQHPQGTIDGYPDDDWNQVVAINLTGTRNTLAAGARVLKGQGRGGKIIITSSCAGLINVPFIATAYHATKAAATHLGRQLAVELAPYGIRVNTISPANFITNIGGGAMHQQEVQALFASTSLLKRVAALDEIAGLALFLASDASSYVTGVDIPIDGGARLSGKI